MLDDPNFLDPIYATLTEVEGEDGWHRACSRLFGATSEGGSCSVLVMVPIGMTASRTRGSPNFALSQSGATTKSAPPHAASGGR